MKLSSKLVPLWLLVIGSISLTDGLGDSIIGACAGGSEFTIFEQALEFEEAVKFCVRQGSTLARIGNANEHFQVVDLMIVSNFGNQAWIGTTNTCIAY